MYYISSPHKVKQDLYIGQYTLEINFLMDEDQMSLLMTKERHNEIKSDLRRLYSVPWAGNFFIPTSIRRCPLSILVSLNHAARGIKVKVSFLLFMFKSHFFIMVI